MAEFDLCVSRFSCPDQEGGGSSAIGGMAGAVASGNVTEESVNTALSRLLRVRIQLGMLDPPTLNPWNELSNTTVESPDHIAFAREVARQSICLYKNANSTLPLDPTAVSPTAANPIRLALIGPQTIDGDLLYGNYAQEPDAPGVVTILQGFFDVLNLSIPCTSQTDYDYYQPGQLPVLCWSADECAAMCSTDENCNYYTFYQNGCYLKSTNTGGQASPGRISGACTQQTNIASSLGCPDVMCGDDGLFPEALRVASEATHIILTLGLDARTIETEGHDRADINLPSFQYELVTAIKQQMTQEQRLICVFIHGGQQQT
jgi:hypothetical protein